VTYQKDYGGRKRRDPRVEEYDQYDGGSAELIRIGSNKRVAREVGSEGKLGGQAKVKGVGGTWKDLTDSVNKMAVTLPRRCVISPR
jgi:hypothetical protein